MESLSHTTNSVTVQVLESKKGTQFKNPGDVDFMVKYPEGYAGPKYIPEGVITTSKESAEDFAKRGIGQIVTPATEEAETTEVVEQTPSTEEAGKGKKPGKK